MDSLSLTHTLSHTHTHTHPHTFHANGRMDGWVDAFEVDSYFCVTGHIFCLEKGKEKGLKVCSHVCLVVMLSALCAPSLNYGGHLPKKVSKKKSFILRLTVQNSSSQNSKEPSWHM